MRFSFGGLRGLLACSAVSLAGCSNLPRYEPPALDAEHSALLTSTNNTYITVVDGHQISNFPVPVQWGYLTTISKVVVTPGPHTLTLQFALNELVTKTFNTTQTFEAGKAYEIKPNGLLGNTLLMTDKAGGATVEIQ